MAGNIKEMTIRFNLSDPDQKRAYDHLQAIDRKIFRSCNQAVCLALLDYFDRYNKTQEDPYLETREREDRFVQQIVENVGESLRQSLPMFLAGCMTGISAMQPVPSSALQVAQILQTGPDPGDAPSGPNPDSIDLDFLGS